METKVDIKDLVKNNNVAKFTHYYSGAIYYEIVTESIKAIFPVDITNTEDIGLAEFRNEEKALHMMRYIRKAIDNDSLIVISIK